MVLGHPNEVMFLEEMNGLSFITSFVIHGLIVCKQPDFTIDVDSYIINVN